MQRQGSHVNIIPNIVHRNYCWNTESFIGIADALHFRTLFSHTYPPSPFYLKYLSNTKNYPKLLNWSLSLRVRGAICDDTSSCQWRKKINPYLSQHSTYSLRDVFIVFKIYLYVGTGNNNLRRIISPIKLTFLLSTPILLVINVSSFLLYRVASIFGSSFVGLFIHDMICHNLDLIACSVNAKLFVGSSLERS